MNETSLDVLGFSVTAACASGCAFVVIADMIVAAPSDTLGVTFNHATVYNCSVRIKNALTDVQHLEAMASNDRSMTFCAAGTPATQRQWLATPALRLAARTTA